MAVKTLLTIEDFEALPDDGSQQELNHGELISMPPPMPKHGLCQVRLASALHAFVQQRDLGAVLTEAGFKLGPQTVRAPDVAFVAKSREIGDSYLEGGPDLAIEIVSPDDSAADLREKIQQYLDSGTSLVWVVYPKLGKVDVHAAGRDITVLGIDDVLEAPGLLPGLRIPVRSILE